MSASIPEARIVFVKSGGVMSSREYMTKITLHGRGTMKSRVLRYPGKKSNGSYSYDFGELRFRYGNGKVYVEEDRNHQMKQIWLGGRKVCEGVNLKQRMFPFQMPQPVLPPQAPSRKRPRVNPKSVSLTYYLPESSSFQFVGKHHYRELAKLGVKSKAVAVDKLIWTGSRGSGRWGLLHPVFSFFQRLVKLKSMGTKGSLKTLKMAHKKVGGFDIADSSRISPWAVKTANRLDLIMVPSRCSRDAYKRSGVKTRVEVVPHGLSKAFSAPKDKSSLVPEAKLNVLYFLMHSPRRKGAAVVQKAMSQILANLKGVRLIVKTRAGPPIPEVAKLRKLPRCKVINKWLSEKGLVSLYDSCHVILAPSLGGGFELNVLEGMARGLIAITSDWPAIREYADPQAFIIESLDGKVKPYAKDGVHTGYGANPDPEHLYGLVYHAFENRKSLKAQAEQHAQGYRDNYSWKRTARRIAECLR